MKAVRSSALPPAVRQPAIIDALMEALSPRERRWCGLPDCECSGCAGSVVSRDEWLDWFGRRWEKICGSCEFGVRMTSLEGRSELVCEVCPLAWA
jgi:hypothetical protein